MNDNGGLVRKRERPHEGGRNSRPTRSSRYELLVKIGSGATATVYVARRSAATSGSSQFSRLVAVKRAHPHLVDDAAARRTLLEEARMASGIHHANVAAVQDLEESEDDLLLVMDYVEGGSLAELLEADTKTPLPPAVAVRIVLDVAAGLSAVHEWVGDDGAPLGLLHRDVSPQNVLVGIDGTTKLTDFGLARLVHGAESSRTTGQMQGKAAYVAPEYVDGAPYTVACEVFALGVVLWETVACRRLFRGANEADTLRRVMAAEAPPLSKVAPQVGTALDSLLEKALAKSPDRRFSTVRAFLDALQAAARKNDLMAISSEVGSCVRDRIGPALEKRRSLVRAGLAVAGSSPAAAGGFSETVSMVMDESGVPSIIGEGSRHSRHAAIGEISNTLRSRDDSGEATLVAPSPRREHDDGEDDAVTTDFNKLPEDARALLATVRGQAARDRRPTPLPPPPRSRPSTGGPRSAVGASGPLPPAAPPLFRDATPDRAMTRILPLMPIPGLDGQTPLPFVPHPPAAGQPAPASLTSGFLDRNRPLPRAAYLAIASVAILIAIAILVSPASPPPEAGANSGGSRADAPAEEPPAPAPPPGPTSVVTLGPILPPAPPTPPSGGPAVVKLPDLPSVPTGAAGPSPQLGRARLPPRLDPPPAQGDGTDGSTPPPNPYKKR